MAAPDSFGPTRSGYLALYNALLALRTNDLDRHISRGSFYTQPLPVMIRDMHLLLQAKDPGRRFPQSLKKEDVPQYFKSLLQEINRSSEHDFYGNIERGLRENKWGNIPAPQGETIPIQHVTTPPPESEQLAVGSEQPPVEENLAKDKAEKPRPFRAGGSHPPEIKKPAGGDASNTEKVTDKTTTEVRQPGEQFTMRSAFENSPEIMKEMASSISEKPKVEPRVKVPVMTRVRQARAAISSVTSNPLRNLANQAVVQIIRHPLLKTRLLTAGGSALGGYFVGGAPGAGVGAVLGGLLGPNISSSIGNFMTGGRSQGQSGGGSSGGGGGSGQGGGGGSFLGNQARNIGSRAANLAARRAALLAGRAAAGFFAANAWWIILIITVALIILVVLLMLLCILPLSSCDSGINGPADLRKQITIQKSAPQQVENGESIEYKITVSNKGKTSTSVVVSDDIPADTLYESGDNDPVQEGVGVKRITWDIKSLSANQSKTLTFKVKPQKENFWVINQVTANVSINISYGSSTGLLPSPLPAEIGSWSSTRDMILEAVNKYPEVVAAYQKAGGLTGVPWEVLAGLHFVETGNNPRPSASLVSGREIGVREPDIPPSACAAGVSGPGTPIPMGGGCGFSNFEDSAIYAAKHIMGKNGDKAPTTFEEAVTSLSRYNGGGNRNCGRGVPYNFCPRDFEGEDDPYSMNYFDQKHSEMYLIYCGDGTQCSPFRPFARPGSMAVIRALLGK